MPMLNGKGPEGMGPMTGRGIGQCGTNDSRGFRRFAGRGGRRCFAGRGAGPGRGIGLGRGFRQDAALSEEDYRANLKYEAEFLEARLNAVKAQLTSEETPSAQ